MCKKLAVKKGEIRARCGRKQKLREKVAPARYIAIVGVGIALDDNYVVY